MLESEFIYEFVANKALKGFFFREGRVVPKMELTLEDNKAIGSTLGRVCGPKINTWVRDLNLNKFLEKPLGQIDIADIAPGSIIKIELSHKELIEVIYQGNYEFCVYNDSVGVLHPLDILKALTLSFNKGDAVFFKVFRNGFPYPCEDMLFKGDICAIKLLNTNIGGQCPLSNNNTTTVKSLEKVFAWKAESRPARFIEDNLTGNDQAIFVLDIIKNEYWVNSQFSKHHYDDIVKILKPICNIRYLGNGLQTVVPGKFSFEQNNSQYSFSIKKKMEVSI